MTYDSDLWLMTYEMTLFININNIVKLCFVYELLKKSYVYVCFIEINIVNI